MAERQRTGRLAVKQARSLLARECNRSGLPGLHLRLEACDVEGLPRNLVVHPRAGFREISEADAPFEQGGELAWLMPPGGDPDLVQGAPEAIARMGVVVPHAGGSCAGGGADEDEAEVGAELVGEAVRGATRHVS